MVIALAGSRFPYPINFLASGGRMGILSKASLDFAREHIEKYYDSDFFPKPVEFEALWHQWDEVVKELTSKNISKLWVTPPRVMAAPKPKIGYRAVHQLEPLDAIVYTALAAEGAEAIEAARVPAADKVACSYRLKIEEGSFFSGGAGWSDYVEKTEELAAIFKYVLLTDITDFYNQIYLHRLNNAIEHASPKLKSVADDIEFFISALNNKASQGIPVGPAASIVMAEALLIDVDEFIKNAGFQYTRYVDDFRIFADSEAHLLLHLERLTLYLYEHHRLTLSSEKTKIQDAKEFVQKYLHNQTTEEKVKLFKTLAMINPYTDDIVDVQIEVFDEDEVRKAKVLAALQTILKFSHLDLGLARSVIRTAKRNQIVEAASVFVDNLAFFAPVVSDVVLYLVEVTDTALAKTLCAPLEKLVLTSAVDNQLVRYWLEWYLAQSPVFLANHTINAFIFGGPNVDNQAKAAITLNNLAWIRGHKGTIYNLGTWARRAVFDAARILPSDEREPWLKLCIANSPLLLDRWVARWVLETA
jgi:Reverse transcriptase (RNA-dependent DNA polymerase)